jgi:hypothetical protein
MRKNWRSPEYRDRGVEGGGGGEDLESTSENCRSNYPLIAFLLPYFLPVCRIKKIV